MRLRVGTGGVGMALGLPLTARLRLRVGWAYCGSSDGAEYCTAVCMVVVAVEDVVVGKKERMGAVYLVIDSDSAKRVEGLETQRRCTARRSSPIICCLVDEPPPATFRPASRELNAPESLTQTDAKRLMLLARAHRFPRCPRWRRRRSADRIVLNAAMRIRVIASSGEA